MKTSSHTLRSLGEPKPIRVQVDRRSHPVAVYRQGQRVAVEQIEDRWRIDDEWWRSEVSRTYFRVVLAGGHLLVVFHDLIADRWYTQMSATPKREPEPVRVLAPKVETVEAVGTEDLQGVG
jgi:hypothetical protein